MFSQLNWWMVISIRALPLTEHGSADRSCPFAKKPFSLNSRQEKDFEKRAPNIGSFHTVQGNALTQPSQGTLTSPVDGCSGDTWDFSIFLVCRLGARRTDGLLKLRQAQRKWRHRDGSWTMKCQCEACKESCFCTGSFLRVHAVLQLTMR